jgi:type I restriction enzyme S subunit
MKLGWEIKRLSEIGKVYNGNSINEKVKKDNYSGLEDGFPFIATKDISYDNIIDYDNGIKIPFEEKSSFKTAPKNTVLICAEGGSAGRKIGFTNQEVCFGNKLFAINTNKNIESRYIYYYYFSSTFQKHFAVELAGIIGGVSMNKFKDLEIPLPALPEQQRIVTILDEAFAAIAKAKANAEKNLKNAKELFESYLQGVFENENWERKTIGETCDEIFAGGDAPKNNYSLAPNEKHQIPIYANAVKDKGLYGFTNFARVTKPSITISARGSGTGHTEIRFENFLPIVRLIVLIPNLSLINLKFLKHSIDNLDILRSGSAIPQLTVPMIKEYNLPLPSLKEQDAIVEKLSILQNKKQKLENIYQQKINDLEELKKSILQKAFSGELIGKGLNSTK